MVDIIGLVMAIPATLIDPLWVAFVIIATIVISGIWHHFDQEGGVAFKFIALLLLFSILATYIRMYGLL